MLSWERVHRVFLVLMALLVLTGSTYARRHNKVKESREKHNKHPDLECKQSKKTGEKQVKLAKG